MSTFRSILKWVKDYFLLTVVDMVIPPPTPKKSPLWTHEKHERLTPSELKIYAAHLCPDCGRGRLLDITPGDGSVNVYCSDAVCGSGFCDSLPFGVERITDASPRGSHGR